MVQLPRLFVLLLLTVLSWPLLAQEDSTSTNSARLSKRSTGRLKGIFRYTRRSAEEADSMVSVARQLDYPPVLVVALSQLASIRLQQQQTQQAAALLEEAARVSGQIRDVADAGWAMSQVGRLQVDNRPFTASFVPVMESLGQSMRNSALGLRKDKERTPFPADAPVRTDRRQPDRRSLSPSMNEYLPSIPLVPPTFSDPGLAHHFRIRPDFVDRLIDTLIRVDKSNPQVISQLKARKKLRDSSQALSKAFAKEGDYAKAYQYYLQYSAYKDSLTAEATSRRLASLAYKQNLLKKEAEIQLLTKDRQLREQDASRQRQFVLILIGCVALLAAFLLMLSRNNRAKHRANQQLNEQKEALQQTLAELKTTQGQLIHAEKMASLGELTAGIAHEIQNPLNFVNNFSEVSTELVGELIENHQSPERDDELEADLLGDLQQNLQKINQYGNRASSIVKGMLEHSRTSTGQKEPTNVNALAEEYLKLAYHGLRAKDKSFDARLTMELEPDLEPVSVVPQEIGRVLLNVFNNAFYAVHKRKETDAPTYQPEVRLRTYRQAGAVVIRVRDNGTGIPEAIKQKIFQPFFTTKPSGQGTGLGLSLSYDIITKGHGGTFVVDSQEGQFTELIITLPVA